MNRSLFRALTSLCSTCILLTCLFIGFGDAICAQSVGTTPAPLTASVLKRDQSAVDLLRLTVQASGAASAIPNTSATGRLVMANGPSGAISIQTLDFDRFRTETRLNGLTRVLVVDGDTGFTRSDDKTHKLPTWIAESMYADTLPFTLTSSWSARQDFEIVDMGEDNSTGVPLSHIHIRKKSDGTALGDADERIYDFEIFINPADHTIRRIRRRSFAADTLTNSLKLDIVYDDYRTVSGVLIPFHITYLTENRKTSEVFLDSVSVGAGNTIADLQ